MANQYLNELRNKNFPYQSIDSGKFYKKVNSKLSANSNISFFKNLGDINSENSLIFTMLRSTEKCIFFRLSFSDF